MAKQEKKKPVDKIPQKKASKRHTIKEKVRLHIKDKNDVVTDTDIREAIIEPRVGPREEPHEKHQLPETSGAKVKDVKTPKRKRPVTPWDMVDDKGEP